MKSLPTLPIEIVNNILEMNGGLIHKENMDPLLKNIPLTAAHIKVKNIASKYNQEGIYHDGNFAQYINAILSYNEKEHLMKSLLTCNCCKNHKLNRPTLKQFYKGTYISTEHLHPYIDRKCKCSCRHMMRWICRTTTNFILDNDNDELFNEQIHG